MTNTEHKRQGKGFEILDFPCNQFANQAPGTEDEIHEFCTLKFGTEFPQFAKIDVNGENADRCSRSSRRRSHLPGSEKG